MNNETKPEKSPITSKGGRNLIILGIFATLIALTTTFISLKLYHDSGDIYLDRSRPGFLPEKEETEKEQTPTDYSFPPSGQLDKKALDEYLEHLTKELDRLNDFSDEPFGATPLSDKTLDF